MRGQPIRRLSWLPVLVVATPLACTTITVRPVDDHLGMTSACIGKNPDVLVSDFLRVLEDGLTRHGIASRVYSVDAPSDCEFIITYTALRSWDMAPYLVHAEIRVERYGVEAGYGEYHLRNNGGYSMLKWQGTRKKMDPVIDRLFAGYDSR